MSTAPKLAVVSTAQPCGYYSGDDLMTAEEVAAWLKVKPSWVFEQTRRRAKVRCKNPLPHTQLGKYLRFSRLRISEWLTENSS
jgi:hypothetical protein